MSCRIEIDANIVLGLMISECGASPSRCCGVLHCLPATIAEPGHHVANGTVLRESTVHGWARDAGFDGAENLAIDNDFWRFYRLDP